MTNEQKSASLWLSVALGAVDAVMQLEKPQSARWNRLKGAVKPINRAVDLYRLEEFGTEDMANASAPLDTINSEIRRIYP